MGAYVLETHTAPIFMITDGILDVTLYVHDAPRPYQLNNFMPRAQQKVVGKQTQSAPRHAET
jgi:hypothetical protein